MRASTSADEEVVYPTLRGMKADGNPYQGVLYVGLMIDAAGTPKVIEFNVRFGDPRRSRCCSDGVGSVPLLDAAARGGLSRVAARRERRPSAWCSAPRLPARVRTGKPIHGLAEAAQDPDVVIFHAGTNAAPDGGFVTAGVGCWA